MAIVDTINSMYENVGEVYDTITNVDLPTNKNIENIPSTIRKSYLDIMNNGIDTIYDNWEKVNGTGTSLTLNNTEEAPMTIEYKGNTSQGENPTPTTPQDIHIVSGDNYINVVGKNLIKYPYYQETLTNNGITWKSNSDGTITINGTATAQSVFYLLYNSWSFDNNNIFPQGTYTLSMENGNDNVFLAVNYYDENNANAFYRSYPNQSTTFNITDKRSINMLRVVVAVNTTVDNLVVKPQIEKGTTATTYEEYKGASYEINLGVDNLVNPSLYNMGGSYNVVSFNEGEVISTSITGYAGVRIALGQNIDLKNSDEIYVRLKIKSDVAGDVFNTIQLMNTSNAVITTTDTKVLAPTMTTEYQEYIMKFVLGNDDTLNKLFIQHKGSSNNTFIIKDIQVSYTNGSYTPYGKAIELCKIGTYQDRIFKSSGKNLYNGLYTTKRYINYNTGEMRNSDDWSATDYIEIEPNTSYTLSGIINSGWVASTSFYDNNKTFISSVYSTIYSFTTPANAKYLRFSMNSETPTRVMLNEGSTALPYEPYGKDWYLNKQIGKVVLDGSENWQDAGTDRFNNIGIITNYLKKDGAITYICNNYQAFNQTISNSGFNNLVSNVSYGFNMNSSTGFDIRFKHTGIDNVNDFKTWLSTHNTIIYFVLATPTYEKITGELLNQLEAIKKSYENQTNINQENNDLPFELEAGALEKY